MERKQPNHLLRYVFETNEETGRQLLVKLLNEFDVAGAAAKLNVSEQTVMSYCHEYRIEPATVWKAKNGRKKGAPK